ncbi:MAG: phosphoribosylglycinamide synthetase C domain-containing protein [Cloacibacillus evryensis]
MASGGYPDAFEKGCTISGADEEIENTFVYHAGTKLNDKDELVTNGGRVLTVVGLADDLPTARERAYGRVKKIHFAKAHYRNAIGDKSLKRGK